MEHIEEGHLVESEYSDLVFIFNIHQVFDENIFNSAITLRDLFEEFKSKKKM